MGLAVEVVPGRVALVPGLGPPSLVEPRLGEVASPSVIVTVLSLRAVKEALMSWVADLGRGEGGLRRYVGGAISEVSGQERLARAVSHFC